MENISKANILTTKPAVVSQNTTVPSTFATIN
jgi:hypothetical protein